MGSRQDAIMSALEANGPMTARQLSLQILGDEAHGHCTMMTRGLNALSKYGEVAVIGLVETPAQPAKLYSVRPCEPRVETVASTKRARIIGTLHANGPMTARQLSEAVGITLNGASSAVRYLTRQGKIEIVGKRGSSNLYAVVEGA